MIVIDTNIASALMARQRDEAVDRWLNATDAAQVWLPTLVVYEISGGINLKADGKRKRELEAAFAVLLGVFAERILLFDTAAAMAAACIAANRERRGRRVGDVDTMLAGLCVSRSARVATRNVRHFSDLQIEVINPWKPA